MVKAQIFQWREHAFDAGLMTQIEHRLMPAFTLTQDRLLLPAYFTLFRTAQPGQQAQQRGFTGTIGAFNLHNVTCGYAK